MKLIIAGSARFTNYQLLCQVLAPDRHRITQVLTGGARGADQLGFRWAVRHHVRSRCFTADWARFGKSAGVRRNHQIAQAGDMLVVFWDGRARHRAPDQCMQQLGKPVVVIRTDGHRIKKRLARVQALLPSQRAPRRLMALAQPPYLARESPMATTVSHPVPSAQAQAIADLTGYEDAATLRWQQACVQAANTLTALPNGRYVNVRMERMRQGLELAQRGAVTLPEDGEDLSAVVRSGNNVYQVDTRLLTCTCADYQKHLQACKHLLAVEVHLGALGLLPPSAPEPAAAEEPAPVQDPAPMTPAPSTASWPISEAPASLNIKLKVGNMEFMLTMRDVDDLKLQRRATMSLPWLTDILHGCEANLAARQQEAERSRQQAEEERQAQARPRRADRRGRGGRHEGPDHREQRGRRTEATRPTSAGAHSPVTTDPSWCAIHRCKMERRTK